MRPGRTACLIRFCLRGAVREWRGLKVAAQARTGQHETKQAWARNGGSPPERSRPRPSPAGSTPSQSPTARQARQPVGPPHARGAAPAACRAEPAKSVINDLANAPHTIWPADWNLPPGFARYSNCPARMRDDSPPRHPGPVRVQQEPVRGYSPASSFLTWMRANWRGEGGGHRDRLGWAPAPARAGHLRPDRPLPLGRTARAGPQRSPGIPGNSRPPGLRSTRR